MQRQDRGKRRGRQPERPDPESGPVGAFADLLHRLKQEAGDPSYAEMASRLGAAASKSSLASAAQGRKLPTWETTWEYVRVLAVDRLGGDPEETRREWRERWERAKADSSPTGSDTDTDTDPASEPTGMVTDRVAGPGDPWPSPRRARRRHLLVQALASAAAAVVAAAAVNLATNAFDPPTNTQPDDPRMSTPASLSPAPVDDSEFVADVTYPDGTKVRPGSSFTKVWRIRNTGTVAWENRFLARVNESPCRSPEKVSVPATAPGDTVDIAVRVTAAEKPGTCRIYWKMADAQGRVLFPLKRPVFLDVQVDRP